MDLKDVHRASGLGSIPATGGNLLIPVVSLHKVFLFLLSHPSQYDCNTVVWDIKSSILSN